jgi:hypothetical protein
MMYPSNPQDGYVHASLDLIYEFSAEVSQQQVDDQETPTQAQVFQVDKTASPHLQQLADNVERS